MTANRLVDITALKDAGVKVGGLTGSPDLVDEALALASVLQTWSLTRDTHIMHYDAAYAKLMNPGETWTSVYVIELVGRRICVESPPGPHPLAYVPLLGAFRLLALVEPESRLILRALVQPEEGAHVLLRLTREAAASLP